VRIHEAHLFNLKASTQYAYRVGGRDASGKEAWSSTFQFRTAPETSDGAAEVQVAVLGDSRNGLDVWRSTINFLMQNPPSVIFFSGDAVDVGSSQPEWDDFFDIGEPLFRQVPVLSAHGNHDYNSVNYFSQFALPGNEENYGIDYGPFHLAVINDTPVNAPDIQEVAAPFLDGDLTAHPAPWTFVMHHRPTFSAANAHGSDITLRGILQPIIDQHKVDLVFNGHDHDYERTRPLRGANIAPSPQGGTIYVVCGGAGAPLYTSGTQSFTAYSVSSYAVVTLRVRKGALDFAAFQSDGSSVDTMPTITK
jgi:hypothetical protein